MSLIWFAHSDYWDLYHDVTFDGPNRIIYINEGVTEITVKSSIYSAWKEWASLRDYTKYVPAIRSVGGDSISETAVLGDTYFLINGWRIQPWVGNYRLNVYGNLYTEEGDSPFIPAARDANILINATVSDLVQSIIVNNNIPSLTQEESDKLFSIPSSASSIEISGLTEEQAAKLMSIPTTTLLEDERSKLFSLNNVDMQSFVDAVWDKQLPGTSVTVAEYILNKLLTTNKFIGLKD